MRTFTTMINMSPPLSHQSYNDTNLRLYNVYEKATKESMSVAVNDLKKTETLTLVLKEVGKSEFIPPRMALLPMFLAKTKIIDYKVFG